MNKISKNYDQFLPLNRKERFYTGTVLPAIICYDNFKYINNFFKLIPGFNNELKIFPNCNNNNILFQTEYSFKESLVEKYFIEKFEGNYETKDTPDIVILITEPEMVLFVGEAKMFSNANAGDINNQMKNQEWFIQAVKKGLNIKSENCYHFALLPEKLIPNKSSINYPVIFWEEIIQEYNGILENNYFFNVLCLAIDKFDALRASSFGNTISYGMNMDFKLSGQKIVELHKNGEHFWVGRFGGRNGDKLKTDVLTNGWRNFEYEINTTSKVAPNRNWFSSTQFVEAVEGFEPEKNALLTNKQLPQPSELYNKSNLDDWHFAHLGRDYFLEISSKLGFGGKWDSPIYLVYIGKSVVPYIEKKRGRNVNPNWSVITKDGKEYKFKSGSSNMVENGLWDKRRCNVFKWDEIRTFLENQLKIVTK